MSDSSPCGFTTPRLERLRTGLPPQPQSPIRQVTPCDIVTDIAVGFARGGATVVAAVAPFAVAFHRWFHTPIESPNRP